MPILNLTVIVILIAAASYKPPENNFLARRWFSILLLAVSGSVILYSFSRDATPGAFTFDDSYISLAAARNVAEHFEMSVVRGHVLQGITSPLHVLLVGILGRLTGVEPAARIVSLLSFFAAALGCGLYAEKLTEDRRAFILAAALCLFSGPMLYDIGNGMETSLFTALAIWSFYLAAFAKPDTRGVIVTGAVIGMAMLTRPEGHFVAAAALGVPALAAIFRRDWKSLALRAVSGGIAFAVFSPFLLMNLFYTGHFFSATVSAKSLFFMGGKWIAPHLSDMVIPLDRFLHLDMQIIAILAIAGLIVRFRVAELAYAAVFYMAFLTRFPDALHHYRTRYQHPLWPLIALGAALLAYWVAGKLAKVKIAKWAAPGMLAAFFVFAAVSDAIVFKVAFAQDTRNTINFLRPMVMAVNEISREGDLVAAHDVGALIYFSSNRRILDLVGLTDEGIARQIRAGKKNVYKTVGRIMLIEKPSVVILLRDWEEKFLRLTQRAPAGTYKLVWSSAPNNTTGAIYDVYECHWEGRK